MPDEYISRAEALADFEACNAANPHWTPQRVKTLLLRQPAADVADVVRCKDCRYGKYTAWCNGYACCRTVGEYHHADFGCTGGELQTNGGDDRATD